MEHINWWQVCKIVTKVTRYESRIVFSFSFSFVSIVVAACALLRRGRSMYFSLPLALENNWISETIFHSSWLLRNATRQRKTYSQWLFASRKQENRSWDFPPSSLNGAYAWKSVKHGTETKDCGSRNSMCKWAASASERRSEYDLRCNSLIHFRLICCYFAKSWLEYYFIWSRLALSFFCLFAFCSSPVASVETKRAVVISRGRFWQARDRLYHDRSAALPSQIVRTLRRAASNAGHQAASKPTKKTKPNKKWNSTKNRFHYHWLGESCVQIGAAAKTSCRRLMWVSFV